VVDDGAKDGPQRLTSGLPPSLWKVLDPSLSPFSQQGAADRGDCHAEPLGRLPTGQRTGLDEGVKMLRGVAVL
jgi:hypothetical protein